MRAGDVEVLIESPDFDCERIRVRAVSGKERLGRLFRFDVTLVSLDGDGPGVRDLIGCTVALLFLRGDTELHRVYGMISRAEDFLETESEQATYRIEVVPRAHRLTLVRTQDVYVDASVIDIIKAKLELAGLEHDASFHLLPGAEKRYPKREFVIQYQETDLDFLSRLIEHVGITFHFTHHEGRDHIVFTDHNLGHPVSHGAHGGKVRFQQRGDHTDIYRLKTAAQVIPALYAVSDYNYENPLVDLSGFCEVADGFGGGVIEYGANVKDPEESAALARVRAEEHRSRFLVYEGETEIMALSAGSRFRLEGHARVPDGELLVVENEHRFESGVFGGGSGKESRYANTFQAIPSDVPFRPPRVTPRARIYGVTHGVVEADPGVETERPWIDQHGRYIVRVLFDTAEPGERRRASLPIRMAQSHSGRNFGIHFPLRPGTEVLLVFVGGDPDRPIIVGSVPNAVTPTPVVDKIATFHRIRTASGVLIEIDDGR